jgi:acyl carrier protein
MLPFCFIPLQEVPLSANGKLDRKQLPQADQLLASTETYCAPTNDTEETIAALFANILQLEKVGIHDNFFLLGGHSLLATQLAAAIRSAFDCPFELKEIFDHPTVYQISLAVIEQSMLLLGIDDLDDDDLLALLDDL